MFDTYVTIVGNALHKPEWRKTVNTGALVTTFKIASTARRRDRVSGQWIDGNSLRVRVTCWRALASNVKESVTRGDPLIVTGRLFTRDWEDENGVKRISYELEATAVGHDLNRGQAVFQRHKANTSTSAVEDDQAPQLLGGELTESVPDEDAPSQFNDIPFEVARDQFGAVPIPPAEPRDAVETDPVVTDPADEDDPLDGSLEPAALVAEPPPGAVEQMGESSGAAPDHRVGEEETGERDERGRRRGLRRSRVPV